VSFKESDEVASCSHKKLIANDVTENVLLGWEEQNLDSEILFASKIIFGNRVRIVCCGSKFYLQLLEENRFIFLKYNNIKNDIADSIWLCKDSDGWLKIVYHKVENNCIIGYIRLQGSIVYFKHCSEDNPIELVKL
jgi:hypothetical protein